MAKTYNDLYLETRRIFRDHGIEAYNLEARLVVAHAAGKTTERFMRDLRLYTSEEMQKTVKSFVARRLSGEPVAYIAEGWEFYGLPMEINSDVLIPRVDTEVLVDTALEHISKKKPDARVLDLCCGSGCIGIAIAREASGTRVVLVDNSMEALRIAKNNTQLNELSKRINCIEANALERPPMLLGSFDLIVCNPPYIPTGDMEKLDDSVKKHEPAQALDGGEDGLDFYRAILQNWKLAIRDGGTIMFEVGINQAEEVKKLMRISGFKDIQSVFDTGNVERVVYGSI
jgi:protein-(glutamine-N5) methyltransferase, release factor-specific